MGLLTELNRAMTYIEANITDEEALLMVANVTSYSPYHFQRIFNYITDIPISEYIRRRKMSLAAMELQSDAVKIIDLAVKYGYDSADSFSRAFTKQHGIKPSAARQSGVQFEIYPPLTFQIMIKGAQKMNWRIEEKESFKVFGIMGQFKNDGITNLIPGFWDECIKNGKLEKLAIAANDHKGIGNAICGACLQGTNIFPYMICRYKEEDSNTNGFDIVTLPKQTWAVFRADVNEYGDKIPELFGRIYSEWIASSNYEKIMGWDMEVYDAYPDGKKFEEVWIPVKKK